MNKTKLISIVTLLITLTGCNKENMGLIMGGAAGGLIGSQAGKGNGRVAATIAGTMIGGMIGKHIGAEMDEKDKMLSTGATNQALEVAPSGQSVEWRNPDSGFQGSVTPTKTYRESGKFCREFQQVVEIGGKKQNAYGKACRQEDGSWEIVG